MIANCDDCGQALEGVKYGQYDDKRICYSCCAKRDEAAMRATGKAVLYLTRDNDNAPPEQVDCGQVTNWPGTLKFRTGHVRRSRHNIAGTRYDVWFGGPDGATWHGVTYGDNTQLCHCRRTKDRRVA